MDIKIGNLSYLPECRDNLV